MPKLRSKWIVQISIEDNNIRIECIVVRLICSVKSLGWSNLLIGRIHLTSPSSGPDFVQWLNDGLLNGVLKGWLAGIDFV